MKYVVTLLVLFGVIGGGTWYVLSNRYVEAQTQVFDHEKAQLAIEISAKAAQTIPQSAFGNDGKMPSPEVFRAFFETIQSAEIVRFKAWNPQHTIVWSNLSEIIGQTFPDNEEVSEALKGEVELEIEKQKDEHVSERQFGNLAEVYMPLRNPRGDIVGVMEVYKTAYAMEAQVRSNFIRSSWPIALVALFAFLILAFLLRLLINKKTTNEALV